jgi:hypothetical protein
MKHPRKIRPILMAMLLLVLPVNSGVFPDSDKISLYAQTSPAGGSMPNPAAMKVIALFEIVENEGFSIFVTIYDDPRTKWEVDYMEFYDEEGEIFLVSWIDRYGVKRVAIDRALLEEEPAELEGTFVFLAMGTPL